MEENLSIYIVEDDEPLRDSLAALFESEGFDVSSFASAKDFLAHYHPDRAVCLVLDLDVPRNGGLDLMAILGARQHRIPTIVLTGKADPALRARMLGLGAASVLVKPTNPDTLIASVRQSLR
jgi:two-component system response regulator FixJ